MSEYTKVVIETDDAGRMSIGVQDEQCAGHGYRLAGPKFCGCHPGKPTVTAVLHKRDVEEIRRYLRIWDEIQSSNESEKP